MSKPRWVGGFRGTVSVIDRATFEQLITGTSTEPPSDTQDDRC